MGDMLWHCIHCHRSGTPVPIAPGSPRLPLLSAAIREHRRISPYCLLSPLESYFAHVTITSTGMKVEFKP